MNYTFAPPLRVRGLTPFLTTSSPPLSTPTPPTPPPSTLVVSSNLEEKKMIWGSKIWTGFHCILEKMSDLFFSIHRAEVIEIVIKVCYHLPCPSCSEDSKTFLSKINFHLVRTRQDLRLVMFQFHNVVNKKKGYSLFLLENLTPTYIVMDLQKVLQEFMEAYLDKSKNSHQLTSKMIRNMNAETIKNWFNLHYQAAFL